MVRKNFTKSIIAVIVLVMCAVLVFAACKPSNAFKPVEMPTAVAGGNGTGNGGIAVQYGDWIYYVNGYQSSSTANNSSSADIRTGAIVRIKVADLEEIIKIESLDLSSTNKTAEVKKAVSGWIDEDGTKHAGKVQMVVPNFYYTGNTAETDLNGIHIIHDRLYITTPNNELDANGNYLNSQLVLASYKLDGSDMQRHYVFETNAPQLKITYTDSDVFATFVLDDKISVLKVGDAQATVVDSAITSPVFAEDSIYYLNEAGAICQCKYGSTETPKTLVAKAEGSSYTIKSANGDYVYYTVNDGSQTSDIKLYYATATAKGEIALNTIPSGSYYGWKNSVVYTASVPDEVVTMYGIWKASSDGSNNTVILDPAQNDKSITFNKLVGDELYYTVDGKTYTLNLAQDGAQPQIYAVSLSTSATGWATPDVLGNYTFTIGSGSVSVVKYNAATKKNSTSVTLTLVELETK